MTAFLSILIGASAFLALCMGRRESIETVLELIDRDHKMEVISTREMYRDSAIYFAGWLIENALIGLLAFLLALWIL